MTRQWLGYDMASPLQQFDLSQNIWWPNKIHVAQIITYSTNTSAWSPYHFKIPDQNIHKLSLIIFTYSTNTYPSLLDIETWAHKYRKSRKCRKPRGQNLAFLLHRESSTVYLVLKVAICSHNQHEESINSKHQHRLCRLVNHTDKKISLFSEILLEMHPHPYSIWKISH